MPSISSGSLLTRLRSDYPQFTFQNASVSRWSPHNQTIYFTSTRGHSAITLLHELGHAIRDHQTYHQDIELLRCEREAWATAQVISPTYHISIPDEYVDEAMTTYRRWLHDRSRCPHCHHGSLQYVDTLTYRCLLCHTPWRANDARQCGLRRYTTSK